MTMKTEATQEINVDTPELLGTPVLPEAKNFFWFTVA
jgi:hypothetical protein